MVKSSEHIEARLCVYSRSESFAILTMMRGYDSSEAQGRFGSRC
jgi:hypothetical protein